MPIYRDHYPVTADRSYEENEDRDMVRYATIFGGLASKRANPLNTISRIPTFSVGAGPKRQLGFSRVTHRRSGAER